MLVELKTSAPPTQVPTSFTYGDWIGSYMGHPIFSELTDNFGVIRKYKGVVTSGMKLNFEQGCVIATPGLLYEIVDSTTISA